jgi:hypothetical protein
MDVIQDLQRMWLDVQWELEVVPIRMAKRRWLSMLSGRYPPQMEIMSPTEMLQGLRELTERQLKYEGETVSYPYFSCNKTKKRLPSKINLRKRRVAYAE